MELYDDIGRHTVQRVIGPRIDRVLEEPDRAVEEAEVAAAGMEARRRDREVVFLGVETVEIVAAGIVADPVKRVHGIERGEERIAEVAGHPRTVVLIVDRVS